MVSNTKESAGKPFGARFTFPLLLGSTLNPINSSMLATGLVGIAVDFNTGPGATATLVSVLYLCSAIMQPTMGKLSLLFGPRRVFLAGILILFVGAVIGALAPAFGVLLVSRALIGIGSSAAYPTAMALIRRRADAFGISAPTRVIGDLSIAAQITVVLGLPIGGILVGTFGWRALFLVNVPLTVVAFVFAWRGIDRDIPVARARGELLRAVDLPGIALFAATVIALLTFLTDLTSPVWWLVPVVVLLLAAFIVWERRAGNPLIDVRALVANPPLQRTYLRQLISALGIYAALYGTSQWMEDAAGLSPLTVGLILIPLSGLSIVIARICSNRGWVRWPLIIGSIAMVVTGAAMYFITSGSGALLIPSLIGMSLLFGASNGFSGFANQTALYVQAPGETIAVAAGLYRTAGYVGAIFSSSAIGITFGPHVTDAGLHRLSLVILGIGVVAVLLTVFDRAIPVTAGARKAGNP